MLGHCPYASRPALEGSCRFLHCYILETTSYEAPKGSKATTPYLLPSEAREIPEISVSLSSTEAGAMAPLD